MATSAMPAMTDATNMPPDFQAMAEPQAAMAAAVTAR
jgi:hypothetical protein